MPQNIPAKLKELRERADLSMDKLARAIGLKRASSYQHYEDPLRFTKDHLPLPIVRKLLEVLPGRGTPPILSEEVVVLAGIDDLTEEQLRSLSNENWVFCLGEVSAGTWREAFELGKSERKPVFLGVHDTRFPRTLRYAAEVRGDGADQLYPDGTILIFVKLQEAGIRPKPNDKVIVLRHRQGLIEATVRQLSKDATGASWLLPKSSNPRHVPFPVDTPMQDGSEIEMFGLVVGSQRIE